MKKIYFIIFLLAITNQANVFADNNSDFFQLYKSRVTEVCEPYKKYTQWTSEKIVPIIFDVKPYENAKDYEKEETVVDSLFFLSNREEKPLKSAVINYKENMNSIYKCAMINSQNNSIKFLKDRLLKNLDWEIKKQIEPKLESLLNKLDIVNKSSDCKWIWKEIYNKYFILNQVTYETCRYNFYMEYLKSYYWELDNAIDIWDRDSVSITEVSSSSSKIIDAIDDEINHAYKIFPIVFNSYSEFENNYPIHFMLTIIKDDYIALRDKLYKALSPINQVVYKISNAMSIWK